MSTCRPIVPQTHVMHGVPKQFERVTRKAHGRERREGWSVTGYVAHVGDNL
jgi:hypothetical protein